MEWGVICVENQYFFACCLVGMAGWFISKFRIIFMKKNISFHEEKYFCS